MILLLASFGVSLVLATLATVALLRVHRRRLRFRTLRLWRPLPPLAFADGMPEPAAAVPAQMTLFAQFDSSTEEPNFASPPAPVIPYPENNLAPDPSRRLHSYPSQRLDRTYFHQDSGNLEDPVPPHRIAPGPVSPATTDAPRKSA